MATIQALPHRALLHVGTHKTGTTAVQDRLCTNDAALRAAGILVPRAGRSERYAGHHHIAWELGGDERFAPAAGGVQAVLAEIAASGAGTIALSSEEFEHLHRAPWRFAPLVDGLRELGFRVEIVLYLRSQSAYAESLYAELLKHGYGAPFDEFLDRVIGDGALTTGSWSFAFDYERLVSAFAEAVGPQAVIVRPYGEGGASRSPADDFFELLGIDPSSKRIVTAQRLNRRASFGDVVRRIAARHGRDAQAPAPLAAVAAVAAGSRFDPIGLPEVVRFMRRFGAGNARLRRRFGVTIPPVDRADLVRDIIGGLGLDPRAQVRRRLLRAYGRS